MLEFLDAPIPLAQTWIEWGRDHQPQPVYLAEVTISDLGPRYVGAFVTPAETVLGLRAWDDADEGAEPAPWALFDVEKLVRMALHQSGLAFEALSSPRSWGAGFPAHRLANAAVTRQVLDFYRDVSEPLERGRVQGWRWRCLLTAALLAREGRVSHDIAELARRLGVSPTCDTTLVPELRAALQSSVLPERPIDYDFLSDFVVSSRLASG